MYRAYDQKDYSIVFLTRWKEGNTGYPLIDACMRALAKTGWLNFSNASNGNEFLLFIIYNCRGEFVQFILQPNSLTMSPAFTTVNVKCNRELLGLILFEFTTLLNKVMTKIQKAYLFEHGA